jgi:hypothetical protein
MNTVYRLEDHNYHQEVNIHRKIKILLTIFSLIILTGCWEKSNTATCLGYADDDVVYVINANDASLHSDIDKAIIELYEKGKIQTFSLIIPSPDVLNMAQYAADNEVPVGLQLTLLNREELDTRFSPVLSEEQVPGLYNKDGYLWSDIDQVTKHADLSEVTKEFEAQIEKALSMGINITHLIIPDVIAKDERELLHTIIPTAKKYNLPMVNPLHFMDEEDQILLSEKLAKIGFYGPTYYWMYYNPERRKINDKQGVIQYTSMLERAKPGLHHLAIHPANNTEGVKSQMKDAALRIDDYTIWKDGSLNNVFKANNIKFTDYRRLKAISSGDYACED